MKSGLRPAALLLAVALTAPACDDAREAAPDELTIVVQGDRRELEQQDKSLHEREEALQKEKQQLDTRIAELARGLKAAADAQQKQRLEEELRRQQDLEGQINVKATALQAQKSEVEARKQAIQADQERAAQAALLARQAAVASREAKVAEREAQIAQMLKDLDSRSKDISVREKDVALREKAVSAFERQGPPPEWRDPKSVPKAAAVEKRHKDLLADLDARGILISDLPPENQPLNANIYAAKRQGDFARAWDLIGQLSKVVAKLKVDQKFVEQKMVRLQGVRGQAKLSDDQKTAVEKLLRDVTAAFSDGHYDTANKGLNRIAVILDANAASG
jgi:hypothetical protein